MTGFSTTLHFPSPDSQPSSTLHASGLPVGSPSKDSPFAGMVTAQNGGTANITAAWTDCASWYYNPRNHPPCQCPADTSGTTSSTVTVLYPKSLSIVAGTDNTTKEATCSVESSTGCGVTRTFTYQVLDQNGHAMTGSWIASQQFWDAVQVTSPDGLGLKNGTSKTTCSPPNTGPCGIYVNSLGRFEEAGLGACSTACYANKTCVTAG